MMTKLKLRTLTPQDAAEVAQIEETKKTRFYRDPDRPDSRYVRSRVRVAPEVKKAKASLRTARYRSEMDRMKRPTTHDVGMSLAVALATTNWRSMLTPLDYDLLQRALLDLQARGFSIDGAKKTMRRLRIRLVDPADREGEPDESCGMPIRIAGEPELPF
jgi:hypothetical protein